MLHASFFFGTKNACSSALFLHQLVAWLWLNTIIITHKTMFLFSGTKNTGTNLVDFKIVEYKWNKNLSTQWTKQLYTWETNKHCSEQNK
jgi:hypothetical protein